MTVKRGSVAMGIRIQELSDSALEASLRELLHSGARTEARIAAHLAEVDARRLFLAAGFTSLYEYCLKELKLSENEAIHRIAVARVASAFPIALDLLEQRSIHLSAICVLRRYLTPENHRELLEAACGKTRRQVEELVAERFPGRDVRSELRRLPRFDPVTGTQYRLTLGVSLDLKAKLELLRDLLAHSNPTGDLAVVVERAVDLALLAVQKRRFGMKGPKQETTSRKSPDQGGPSPKVELHETRRGSEAASPLPRAGAKSGSVRRAIPNAVKREVATRDELRCTYVSPQGRRCTSQAFLQLHHVEAWAKGGADSVENLRLLCASHNALLAERDFGPAAVKLAAAARRVRSPSPRKAS